MDRNRKYHIFDYSKYVIMSNEETKVLVFNFFSLNGSGKIEYPIKIKFQIIKDLKVKF